MLPVSQRIVCLLAAVWFLQPEPPPNESDRSDRLRFMQARAAGFELARETDPDKPFSLHKDPILRYTNPERVPGSTDGATFVWLDGTRPVAAVSFSIRNPNEVVFYECTSFVEEKLICRNADQQSIWTPRTGGLVRQTFPEAPEPARSKAQRLTQVRSLARKFTATCYHPKSDAPFELRLLSQPLYRFEATDAGILDGAIFAFVVSNDPELLLRIDAFQPATGKVEWRYTLARMSSWKQKVSLDGKEVWAIDNYYQILRRAEGHYCEARAGNFVPGEPLPEATTPAK